MDLARKERGSRYAHVDGLLRRLTGAEAALVVNNCASAVLLALESLARGKEVIVSRGELIEIGGEFRIPDIMRRSGAILREVGTTNRTHLKDYASAIGPETGLILKVHTSNYRVVGFTAAVSSRELAELGRARAIPVMEDLGSGCFVDLRPLRLPLRAHRARGGRLRAWTSSPSRATSSWAARRPASWWAAPALVERLARNPLNRALRIDKFTVAALEATLYAYEAGDALETIPTLRMLTEPLGVGSAGARARSCAGSPPRRSGRLGAQLVEATSQVGGGALPTVELPTAAIALGTAERAAERWTRRSARARRRSWAASSTTACSSTAARSSPPTSRPSPRARHPVACGTSADGECGGHFGAPADDQVQSPR